jgi:hypothetical protein
MQLKCCNSIKIAHTNLLFAAVMPMFRLQKGQLGHGDLLQRNNPTPVAALEGKHVTAGVRCLQDNWLQLVAGMSTLQ